MSGAAWIMLLVAVVLLGGGLSLCIGIAIAVDKRKRQDGVEFQAGEADD